MVCSGQPRVAAWARTLVQGAKDPPAVSRSGSFGADGTRLLEAVAGNISAGREGGLAPEPA